MALLRLYFSIACMYICVHDKYHRIVFQWDLLYVMTWLGKVRQMLTCFPTHKNLWLLFAASFMNHSTDIWKLSRGKWASFLCEGRSDLLPIQVAVGDHKFILQIGSTLPLPRIGLLGGQWSRCNIHTSNNLSYPL